MAIPRVYVTAQDALSDIENGSSIMIGGEKPENTPGDLLLALKKLNPQGISLIANECGVINDLAASGLLADVLTSVTTQIKQDHFAIPKQCKDFSLKITPEKVLSEGIRARGAGLGGVYLAAPDNKIQTSGIHPPNEESRLFVEPVKADIALVRALKADTLGNLVYGHMQENWSHLMARAAITTIVEVNEIVAPGELSPELIMTPGIYVDRLVLRCVKSNKPSRPATPIQTNKAAENKIYSSGAAATSDIADGSTILIDGFAGPGGMAQYLLVSLRDQGAKDLTMVSNSAGIARVTSFGAKAGFLAIDHSILFDNHQISKVIASFPVSPSPSQTTSFELAYRDGEVRLELVAQGTLAERIRSGGNGVLSFYTPTGVSTIVADGKEIRLLGNRPQILEPAIRGDFAIIRAHKADTFGNLVYRGTSRNFNAIMAPAADITIAEVDEIVELGQLDPEEVVTPGKFVHRIVKRPHSFSPYERIK